MSVAITAQVPVESIATPSPASASPQAGQGTGATTEQGLVDFFGKAHLDAVNGQTAEATNSVASSGDMLGKLREFIDKAHQADAKSQATRVKQRAAAAQAKTDLATLDTLGSLSQFNPLGQSGSVGQFTSINRFASVGRYPGPASASLGPGLGLASPGVASPSRMSAMVDKMTNDAMDSAIHRMWTQVVANGATSVTKSVMTLLKGQ
jgi:hypothetical protein